MKEPTGQNITEVNTKQLEAKLIFLYEGHPKPKLTWYNNHNQIIFQHELGGMDKYKITTTDNATILIIKDLKLKDSGYYTLIARNTIKEVNGRILLRVIGLVYFTF